jgi:ATP-binding cassette subfamily C protein CydD
MRVLRVSFLSGFALEVLASISVAIIAVSIGFRLIDGSLALGVGLFVLLLAPEAYLPLRQVGVQFHAAAEGVAATDDVFDVLDAARSALGEPKAAEPTAAEPAVALPAVAEPVEASAPGAVLALSGLRVHRGHRTLAPVDLVARPGTVTLIEGPSGAGKTSVFAALLGSADFDGAATLGGHDVRDIPPSTWLAWAGQQPGLVSGTVHDNVSLGDHSPDPRVVRAALVLACADEIDPDMELGVQGAGLSGGQAQRVAVARALYRRLRGKAGVVALDEPSSALDADTEAELWRTVRQVADDGATVLLVSHRTTARAIADEVVRLEPSEVVV